MLPFKNITNVAKPGLSRVAKPHTSQGNRDHAEVFPTKVPVSNKENRSQPASAVPPYISAKSWAVASGTTGGLLFGRNYSIRREVASLTKIMTCYTVLELAKRWNMDMETTLASVSRQAAFINGTRADFRFGDKLSIWDLLHAMMLPSGNDAALCFAEFFGQLLFRAANPAFDKYAQMATKFPCKYFINEMNVNAKMLGLEHTTFANPHGLANTNNKSTAEDLGKLCAAAMKVPKFRQVISCREYDCQGFNIKGQPKKFRWTNTQKLLWEGFNGVKTGVTPHAGPCLASSYEADGVHLIIILLSSKNMEARWSETHALKNWAKKRLCDVSPLS